MEEVVVDRATEVLPKLRFPQYAGPWKKGPIGKHIEFVSGVALPGNEISEEKGGVAILRGINITEGSVRHSPDIDRYYHGSLEGIEHLLLKEGDLVLGMDGSKVGKNTAVISKEDEGSLLIQRVARIRPTGTASIDFIYHHIFSYRFHDYVDVVNTSSGIPHISGKQIRDFEVAFPTLPEQQKIAAFLGAVDRKIQQLKRKRALLEQYKQGVVQQLFSQELRFKRKDGGEYPEWEEVALGELFERVKRKNVEDNSNVLTISAQYGLINQEEYFHKSVSAANVTGYYLLHRGEFAYNKSYSKGYPMGATKRLNAYDKGVVSPLYICFRLTGPDSSDFYEQYFESGVMNTELEGITQEGARNHGMLNISIPGFFSDITIPRPSLEEQSRIAGFLMALDAKVAGVARAVAAAQKWKKGLLQQMFV